MSNKSHVFTMRLPLGDGGSLEQAFLAECESVDGKANFMRRCLYGGYLLSECGLLDKLLSSSRRGELEGLSVIEQLVWLKQLIGETRVMPSEIKPSEQPELAHWLAMAE